MRALVHFFARLSFCVCVLRVLPLPVLAGTTGQQFVAVGQSGQVLTSPEGVNWTPRASGTSVRLRAVAASPNLFVAAGHNGTIVTSPDGVAWTPRSSGTTETLRGAAFNATKFVTVGGTSAPVIRYSADGITWNAAIISASAFTPGALRAVAWGNNQFVAVGSQSTVLTSLDGITWTVQTAGAAERYDGVVWTGTEFMVLTQTGKVLRGTDGISWVTSQSYPPLWLEGLAWSDTRYVAVGATGTIKTSVNGSTWSTSTSGTAVTLHGIAWSGTQFVPAGDPVALLGRIAPYFVVQPVAQTLAAGATATFNVLFSVVDATLQWFKNGTAIDGQTSSTLTLANVQPTDIGNYSARATYDATNLGSDAVPLLLLGLGTTGQQFVAVGATGNILTSPDGLTWTPRMSGTTVRLRAVAATPNLFVAVGQAGTVLTSPTGAVWTPRTVPFFVLPMLRGIAASPTRFVAVGGNAGPGTGQIITSLNGISWSLVGIPSGPGFPLNSLRAVVYGNDQFVTVGLGGVILTSPNGTTWTARTSGTTERLDGVVWTGSQYVVLSQTGKILTSADGITWASSQSFPPTFLEGIAWSDSRYVAVGSTAGVIYNSTDGDHWSSIATPTVVTLHGIAWSGATMSPSGDPAALLGNISPYIVIQPLAQSVAKGASATFKVAVSSLNATYQWFKNLIPIGGATGSTLPLTNVQSADAGSYRVQISAGSSTLLSDSVPVALLGEGSLGKQFISVGANGTILTSPSGETWTSRVSGTTGRLRGAAAAADLAVAVGETGIILTSPNGVTWTPRSSGTPAITYRGVARNQTHFVAVGGITSSVVLRSADGITWAVQSAPSLGALRAVAWGDDVFVAVGNNGFIMTSPTGEVGTWTVRASGVISVLDGVAWLGTQFAVITRTGSVLTSPNGITWSIAGSSVPPSWLEGLAGGDGQYVAVGASGNIATSPNGVSWLTAISGTTKTLHGVAWTGGPPLFAGSPIDFLNNIALDPYVAWAASKGLTPAQSGLTADPDADGIVNVLEYFLGLNPTVSDATGVPTGQIDGSDFAFRFNRSKTAVGATYRVATSNDLVTWTTALPAPVLESSTVDRDTYVVKIPMTTPRLFVRLEVTLDGVVVGGP